jgi:hypothetical protein
MAKGKRAVALFEVIHKDKRLDRKSPPPESPRIDDSPKFAKKAVDLWRKNHSDPETWSPPGPSLRESIAAFFARLKSIYNSISTAIHSRAADLANSARLWITRSNGVAPGAAVASIVIVVMLAARHWLHPATPADSVADALRAQPPHPNVLIVAPQSPATGLETPASLSPEMAADVQAAGQQPDAQPAAERTISTLAAPGKRIVNMHYVLMQSYFEQKTAQDACDFLTQAGIPCTIERGIKGWRPDFYQVIGLQGFARASGPQYLAYRQKVEELGLKFSPKSRYKRFQPQAIKW